MKSITTVAFGAVENRLLEFMNGDRVSHFCALCDLKEFVDKTQVWTALSGEAVAGYLVEYDKRILYIRGARKGVLPLLQKTHLTTALFNIEPKHFSAVRRLFEVTGPADKMTDGQVTTFTPMKVTPESFTPSSRHETTELNRRDAQAVADLLGGELETAEDLLKGLAFGILKSKRLVSFASSPEMLDDIAIIRGVFTNPIERNKGYSSFACSSLVERLLEQKKTVFLYVSKDNPAAIKVYHRLGFRETGHAFLGFWAMRR